MRNWQRIYAADPGLTFNQNHNDPAKRAVFGNVKFRQAMSLALNREEMNESSSLGLAVPQQARSTSAHRSTIRSGRRTLPSTPLTAPAHCSMRSALPRTRTGTGRWPAAMFCGSTWTSTRPTPTPPS